MKNKVVWIIIGAVVLSAGLLIYQKVKPGAYDGLAQCLKDKGVIFFGAFWCPHCQNQKKLFGNSAKKLPYVECSLPSGKGQTDECNKEGIEGYPTWEFADGSRESKVLTPQELAEKVECTI